MSNSLSKACQDYSAKAKTQLDQIFEMNADAIFNETQDILKCLKAGGNVFVFGCGHSAMFAAELYHRAGGASFVIPLVADFLLPFAGPKVVRQFEKNPESGLFLLERYCVGKNDRVWICSQSGINPATVEFGIQSKNRGAHVVGFTSRVHSSAVPSRHGSGKKLMNVSDRVFDLSGEVGDASVALSSGGKVGPLSTLSSVFLGQCVIVNCLAELEANGHSLYYTSVNTPDGESKNRNLEIEASKRDFLLR